MRRWLLPLLCLPQLLLLLRWPLLLLLLLLLLWLPLVVWLLRWRLLVVVLLLLGLHRRLRRRAPRRRCHSSRGLVVPTVTSMQLLLLLLLRRVAALLLLLQLLLLLRRVPVLLLGTRIGLLLLLLVHLLLLRRVPLLRVLLLLWCTLRQHHLAIPRPSSVVAAAAVVVSRHLLLRWRRLALVVERPLLLWLLGMVSLQGGAAALSPAGCAAFAAVAVAVAAVATGAERPPARVRLLGLLLGPDPVGRLRVARLLLPVAPAGFPALHAQLEVGQGRFSPPQSLSLQQAATAGRGRPLPRIVAMVWLVYAASTAPVAPTATTVAVAVGHTINWLRLATTIAAHGPCRLLRRPAHEPSISTTEAACVILHITAIKRGPRRPVLLRCSGCCVAVAAVGLPPRPRATCCRAAGRWHSTAASVASPAAAPSRRWLLHRRNVGWNFGGHLHRRPPFELAVSTEVVGGCGVVVPLFSSPTPSAPAAAAARLRWGLRHGRLAGHPTFSTVKGLGKQVWLPGRRRATRRITTAGVAAPQPLLVQLLPKF